MDNKYSLIITNISNMQFKTEFTLPIDVSSYEDALEEAKHLNSILKENYIVGISETKTSFLGFVLLGKGGD